MILLLLQVKLLLCERVAQDLPLGLLALAYTLLLALPLGDNALPVAPKASQRCLERGGKSPSCHIFIP